MFIFDTTIDNCVLITKKVSDFRFDLGIKGQGQIYLKYVMPLKTGTHLTSMNVVNVLYNDCLW